jgi:hypothetical protein
MKITADLLRKHGACDDPPDCQVARFAALWPDGAEPTVEALTEAAACGLDVWWLVRVLPLHDQRRYAWWCASQVAYLTDDQRVHDCLATVRRAVEEPGSVAAAELRAAEAAAWAAGARRRRRGRRARRGRRRRETRQKPRSLPACRSCYWGSVMVESSEGDGLLRRVVAAWETDSGQQMLALSCGHTKMICKSLAYSYHAGEYTACSQGTCGNQRRWRR